MQFNFKSLTRNGIGYTFEDGTTSTPSYFYQNPQGYVSNVLYEFQTYNDGNVQHSQEVCVQATYYMDAMSSLADHLLNNLELSERFSRSLFLYRITNKAEVRFLASLRYDENKTVYYSLEDQKKTSAKSKEYDTRYKKIPQDADGSGKFVFNTLRKSYHSMLSNLLSIQEIRESLDYCHIDTDEILQTNEDLMNLTNPVNVIQSIVDSFQKMEHARRSYSCLQCNWISRQI